MLRFRLLFRSLNGELGGNMGDLSTKGHIQLMKILARNAVSCAVFLKVASKMFKVSPAWLENDILSYENGSFGECLKRYLIEGNNKDPWLSHSPSSETRLLKLFPEIDMHDMIKEVMVQA